MEKKNLIQQANQQVKPDELELVEAELTEEELQQVAGGWDMLGNTGDGISFSNRNQQEAHGGSTMDALDKQTRLYKQLITLVWLGCVQMEVPGF